MPSKGNKDTALFEEKRKEASKDVKIQFIDETFTSFNVLDESDKVKYEGKIDMEKSIEDECSCDSFLYGMQFEKVSADSEKVQSRHVNENGKTFQCKHIYAAKYARTGMNQLSKILDEHKAEQMEQVS